MHYGEVLSYITRMDRAKVKPFKTWKGSKVQDWEFEIELLDVGKNIEVAKAVADLPLTVLAWQVKVETFARCIITINGESFITQEQLDTYNKEHDLEGDKSISALEYKKILIKKWDQVVINTLEAEYNKLQEAQQTKLLGGREKGPDPEKKNETEEINAAEKVVEETEEVEKKVSNKLKETEVGAPEAIIDVDAHLEKTKEDE